MQVPVRLLRAIRPSEHPGLLLATAYATAVLSVAPFLLPALADAYGIGLATASAATAGQLAGFVVGSWGASRYLLPRGRVLGSTLVLLAAVNLACVLLPPFPLLVALRVLSGVGLGVVTWFSWSQVFGDERRMSEIAVVGPLVGVTTTPIAAQLVEHFGPEGIFWALAATALVPAAFSRRSGHSPRMLARRDTAGRTRHAPTPAATGVLACLGLLTLGGSAVFTFGAVIATTNTDLSLSAISLAYSANAIAAIPSARWTGRRGSPGVWLGVCAASAAAMGGVHDGAVFVAVIALWGFAFWMGVPGAYSLLARASRYPQERAGDAQAVMAAGRVLGPLAGGVLLDVSGTTTLGVTGGVTMLGAALGLSLVDRRASVAVATRE